MALPQHYLAALLLPNGRLDQFGFAILAIVLAVGHVLVWGEVRSGNALETWDWHSIALFAMIWMWFCIMSRRLRDTGSSGFFLVPVLVLAIATFLLALDPDVFGSEFRHNAIGALAIEQGIKIVRGLAIAGFLYCIKAGGQDGENAYGPEFGDGPAFGGAGQSSDDSQSAMARLGSHQQPQHSFRRLDDASAAQWGERRRTSGFGRR